MKREKRLISDCLKTGNFDCLLDFLYEDLDLKAFTDHYKRVNINKK